MSADVLVIVGCSGRKRPYRCRAADLYDPSPLFRACRSYAERHGTAGWLIVSARHGLVRPDQDLDPYDARLPTSREDLRYWAFGAQSQFAGWLTDHPKYLYRGPDWHYTRPTVLAGLRVVVLAGRDYADALRPTGFGDVIETPLAGLGIGERLAWLARDGRPAAAEYLPLFPTLETDPCDP